MADDAPWDMLGGNPMLDFINTSAGLRMGRGVDLITGYADLLEWSVDAGTITPEMREYLRAAAGERPEEAAQVYARAGALRSAMQGIAFALMERRSPSYVDVRLLNEELKRAPRAGALVWDGNRFGGEFDLVTRDLEKPLGGIAWAAHDLLIAENPSQIRMCSNPTCGWLFMDTSRNHSRRWCDMKSCGNVLKARRFRKRKAAAS